MPLVINSLRGGHTEKSYTYTDFTDKSNYKKLSALAALTLMNVYNLHNFEKQNFEEYEGYMFTNVTNFIVSLSCGSASVMNVFISYSYSLSTE